jgi:leucyl-tRNA synthetase
VTRFRSAAQNTIFDFVNDIKWYVERSGGIKNCNKKILDGCLSVLVRLLAPMTPHICEEFWNKLGNKNFVSIAKWPEYDEKIIDKNAIQMEENFRKSIEDLKNVLKITGNKKNLYLYFVADKELDYFNQSLGFIRKQFNFKQIKTFNTNDKKKYDPQNKAAKAKFGKPGIFLE